MNVENLLVFAGIIISAVFIFYFFLFGNIERKGKRYIITGMFFAFYIFVYDMLLYNQLYFTAIWLYILYFPIIFATYPLIYHYLVYAANDKNKRFIVKLLLSIPLLILLTVGYFYIPLSEEEKVSFLTKDILSFSEYYNGYFYYQLIVFLLYYIQLIIFIVLFINLYFVHKKRKTEIEKAHKLYLPGWLFFIVSIIIFYELIFIVLIVFNLDPHNIVMEQSANLSFLILLGFICMKHDEMIIKMKLSQINLTQKSFAKVFELNSDESKKIIEAINELMISQSLYKTPGIKLEHIAKKIHLPVKKLSFVINQHTGHDFSYYVNKLRIEEAKRILKERKNYEKIEDVYLQLGYYTRSTFNRAFNTIEGITPTEYLKSHT